MTQTKSQDIDILFREACFRGKRCPILLARSVRSYVTELSNWGLSLDIRNLFIVFASCDLASLLDLRIPVRISWGAQLDLMYGLLVHALTIALATQVV